VPLKISLSLVCIILFIGNFFATLSPASAEPQALSCPSGRTVWLDGTSPPGESLLIFLAERAVGGGSARSDGSWRLPLRVNERPGSYLVEVRSRTSSAVYAQYTCFVDQPLDGFSPTPTGSAGATSPTAGRSTPTVGSNVPTTAPAVTQSPSSSSQTARPTSTPTGTQTPGTGSSPGADSTSTSTSTSTPTLTRTTGAGGTSTPTQTRTQGPSPTIQANNDVTIFDIFIGEGNASDPDPDLGYAVIQNSGTVDVNMKGWQLVNITFANLTYTFPDVVLPAPNVNGPETSIDLFLDANEGESIDPDELTVYWGLTYRPWRAGDQVELRDATGRKISSFAVTAP
jgi:hypothetical protein